MGSEPSPAYPTPSARPPTSALAFDDSAANRAYKLRFDDEEVAAAFARVGAGGQSVELVFAAAPAGAPAGAPRLAVSVRGASETVPLRGAKVGVYRLR